MRIHPKTNVYIDGFNLYYGAVKDTPYRWLDLATLCGRLLPKHDVRRIRYYTARVGGKLDPSKPVRQGVYLRALRTIPNLDITYGRFLTHRKWMPLVAPITGHGKWAYVIKTEEKGSDVNLATHLLRDGFNGEYEFAVVVSNDSDLAEPIRIAGSGLGLPVGVISPHTRKPSRVLRKYAKFFKVIRRGVIRDSQFPAVLTDAKGSFHRPSEW